MDQKPEGSAFFTEFMDQISTPEYMARERRLHLLLANGSLSLFHKYDIPTVRWADAIGEAYNDWQSDLLSIYTVFREAGETEEKAFAKTMTSLSDLENSFLVGTFHRHPLYVSIADSVERMGGISWEDRGLPDESQDS